MLIETTSLTVGDTIKINGSLYKVRSIDKNFTPPVWRMVLTDMSGKVHSQYIHEQFPLYAELKLGPMEGDDI